MVFLYRDYNINGEQVYAYISIRMDKLNDFKRAFKKEVFNLEDYGTILASGYGDPTPEVMLEMERQYGVKPGNHFDMAPYFTEEFEKTLKEYESQFKDEDEDEQ